MPQRSFEDRAAAKEQMMQSVRESSQQERRVYVGNLAYDVKWHHLKDFMRQGMKKSHFRVDALELTWILQLEKFSLPTSYYFRMECRRWAPMCDTAGYSGLSFGYCLDVGLTDWTWSMVNVGMRVCGFNRCTGNLWLTKVSELWNTQHGNKPNKRSTH